MSTNEEIRARIAADPLYLPRLVADYARALDPETTMFTHGDRRLLMREVIDFWVFRKGRSGRAPDHVSVAAHLLGAVAGRAPARRLGVTQDHLVPMHVILTELFAGPADADRYAEILTRPGMGVVAIITNSEDALLNAAGWRQRHPDPSDPWARYRVVGIEMVDPTWPGDVRRASAVASATSTPQKPQVESLALADETFAPSSPPQWSADPTGKHQHRYWDGRAWTEHVSDSGMAATDPL